MTGLTSRLSALLGPPEASVQSGCWGGGRQEGYQSARRSEGPEQHSAHVRQGKERKGTAGCSLTAPTSEVFTCPSQPWGSAREDWRPLLGRKRSEGGWGRSCSRSLPEP